MKRCFLCFFFFKQKTAYEIRPRDWSSDVCSSDLHRHDAALREQIVEDGEDGLLRLARVRGAADEDEALIKIHEDEGGRGGAVLRGVGAEARNVDDGEFGRVLLSAFVVVTEHRAREERVPGQLRDDADGQTVTRVRAG